MTDDHTELDELHKELHEIVFRHASKNGWIHAANDKAGLLIDLTQLIQQREVAARVDEINELPLQVHSTHANRNYMCVSNRHVRNRLAALKHSQEDSNG